MEALFGSDDKQYFSTGPDVLGWSMAAAFGVKLARPDVPVVSVVDGSSPSGPQPLWTMARYKAPVTVIVLNNHSYNNERNRIWNSAGRQFEAGRTRLLPWRSRRGYSRAASAFGVEEVRRSRDRPHSRAHSIRARCHGRRTTLSTRYSHQARGLGAVSEWHPLFARQFAHPEGVIMRAAVFVPNDVRDRSRGGFTEPCATKHQPSTSRRGARPRFGCVLAMPLPRHNRKNTRRCGRLETVCKQHGASRRAIDRTRNRHCRELSRAQSGSGNKSAAGKTVMLPEGQEQAFGRDAL